MDIYRGFKSNDIVNGITHLAQGFATIGHMGCRMVHWAMNKLQLKEKTCQIADKISRFYSQFKVEFNKKFADYFQSLSNFVSQDRLTNEKNINNKNLSKNSENSSNIELSYSDNNDNKPSANSENLDKKKAITSKETTGELPLTNWENLPPKIKLFISDNNDNKSSANPENFDKKKAVTSKETTRELPLTNWENLPPEMKLFIFEKAIRNEFYFS